MTTTDTTQTAVKPYLRWMIRRDMREVLSIEAQSFVSPWSEEDFLSCLRANNCIGKVVEDQSDNQWGGIVAYAIYELHKRRLHILNLAVAPQARRQGIATLLLRKLIDKLSTHRRQALTVDVGEQNLDAQLFFRAAGFRAISVLRDYYPDLQQDAYRMVYRGF